jgi:branched-chain amino acid transport system substrate-binding protein
MNKLAIALLILVLTGCATNTAQEPVKIGGLFALSGGGESWGTDELAAVQLAIDEANAQGGINGKHIELIAEDTQVDSRVAVSAAQKLINIDHVPVIIGPTWDADTAAVLPVAQEAGTAVISPSASGAAFKDLPQYAYSTWYSDAALTAALQQYASNHNQKRVAIIYNKALWTEYMRDVFTEQATQYGMTVVSTYGITETEEDYRTVLLRIQQDNVDAVYIALVTDALILPLVEQAGEMDLGVPIYSASQNHDPLFAAAFSQYKYGVYQPYPVPNTEIDAFNTYFTDAVGHEPTSPSTASAYDAAKLVIAAMRSGATTGPQIREWLNSVEDFSGKSTPHITFNENGLVEGLTNANVVQTAVNGEFVDAQ